MRILLCTLSFMLCLQHLYSTHVMGANISYRCLGADQYEVSLFVFQNCADPQTTDSEVIRVVPSCDFDFSSHSLSLVDVLEVTQASPDDQVNSSCNGGFLPGVVRLTYTDTISIVSSCPELVLFWKKCNRSTAVNVDNSDSPCFYVESIIKTSAGCNSSAQLSSPTVPYVCGDPNINVNLGAFDPDGDPLRYSLVAAQRPTSGNSHTDLVYETGFSPEEPVSGMSIDPVTGNMSLDSDVIGFYVVAILVEELDANSQVKGSMLVDVQFVVSSCSPYPPYLAEPGLVMGTSSAADLTEDFGVAVCNGSSFCLEMTFQSDDTEDELNVSANIADVIPGAIMTLTGVNPVNMTLCWTAQDLESDRLLIISVANNDEPIPTVISYGLPIINASNDLVELAEEHIMNCGLEISLEHPIDYGSWSGPPSLVMDQSNPDTTLILFPESGTYEMIWTSGCHADTLNISSYTELLAEAGDDDINCSEEGYLLSAVEIDSVSWGLWSASIYNPGPVDFEYDSLSNTMVSMTEPGEYLFYWEVSNPACTRIDSVSIQNGMISPQIQFLDGMLSVVNADSNLAYQWYLNEEIIEGADSPFYEVTSGLFGNYTVLASHISGCSIESELYAYAVSGLMEFTPLHLNISPNPMQEMTLISWSSATAQITELLILDLRGKQVLSQNTHGNSFLLYRHSLAKGVYLVNLLDNQGNTLGFDRLMVH